MLYCLGEDADDVLTSTNISDENRKKYTEVLAKFDGHFKVHNNVILECVQFNRRVQEDDESVEQLSPGYTTFQRTANMPNCRRR